MTIKIAICDDNLLEANETKQALINFFNDFNIKYQITVYTTGKELLKHYKNYDIIFVDIQLKNENGIEIAKIMNNSNHSYKLFLVSNFSGYFKDGFRVNAERYFTKPINQLEFNNDMSDVLKDYIYNSMFIFDEKISKSKIYIKDIQYVEILQRKTYLCTISNKFISNYSLSYWKNEFSNLGFSQTHKAFYVNLNNVKNYDSKNIYMDNGKVIPLSRFYKAKFIEEYNIFLSNKI